VIVGHTDPSLAGDARAFGFDYLHDGGEQTIVDHAQQALDREVPQRNWPRKRLPFSLQAEIAGHPASLMDVSYGGFRVEISESGVPAPDSTFVLDVPEFGVRALATCMWVKPLAGSARWFGAALAEAELVAQGGWRAFVDALQTETATVPGTAAS
jgi:hypothetical protein